MWYLKNTKIKNLFFSYRLPPSSYIRVDSKLVDFGCLVAEHQVVSQRFTVSNDGSREGGFTLDTASLPPHFTLSTSQGKVGPKKTLEIQVRSSLLRIGAILIYRYLAGRAGVQALWPIQGGVQVSTIHVYC